MKDSDVLDAPSRKNENGNFLTRPHSYFLWLAVLLLLASAIAWSESVVLYVDDFSVWIDGTGLVYFTSFWLSMLWLLYRLTDHLLWKKLLSWIHVIVTIGLLLLLFTTSHWAIKDPTMSDSMSYTIEMAMRGKDRNLEIYSISFLTGLIAQCCYPINLVAGVVMKIRNRPQRK
jgi:hypothetical protein